MKYFILDSDEEFLDESGQRYRVNELAEEEKEDFENADESQKIEIKQWIDFCKRSGDVELFSSYIVVFRDGSIFDEYEGSFTPVRIVDERG